MARHSLLLVVVALALVAPSTASAAWLPIEDVGDVARSEESSVETASAANDRGDAVVVWQDARGIHAAVSRRGSAFGPPRDVPGVNGMTWDLGVELSEDGRALIHWRRFNTDNGTAQGWVAGLKVDGGFGTTRSVTPAAPYLHFEPAIGAGGRFTVVYATGTGGALKPTYSRSTPPSGKLGPRRTIATGGITVHDVWYVGSRPHVAFTRPGADRDSKLFERRLDPLGPPRQVASMPAYATLYIDTASNGMQAAVWSHRNTEGPRRPLVAAVRRPGGVFKGQEIDDRLPPQDLEVAVARSGAALVAWRDFNEATTEDDPAPQGQNTPGQIVTSYRSPGGPFGATRAFRPDPEPADVGIVGMDVDSRGMAVLGVGAVRYNGIVGRPYLVVMDRGREPDITPIGEIGGTAGGVLAAIDERGRTVGTFLDGPRIRAMRGEFRR